MEIAPGILLIQRVVCNVYVIAEPGGLTMIDTGLPGSAGRILRQIQLYGRQTAELRRIIITHADPDHIGSLVELHQKTWANVLASKGEAAAVRAGVPSRELKGDGVMRMVMRFVQRIYRPKPGQVDAILTPGEELPVLGGLQVVATPGHTPDHISLWSPSTGILFSGDSIVSSNGCFQPSHGMNNWNVEQSLASFQKQAALHPRYVFGGHSWSVDVSEAMFGEILANGT